MKKSRSVPFEKSLTLKIFRTMLFTLLTIQGLLILSLVVVRILDLLTS